MLRFFNKRIHNKKGFTLIELIVVIAILGILALLAVPRFLVTLENSREGTDEANRRAVASAAQVYFAEEGDFPADVDELVPNYLEAVPEPQATVNEGLELTIDGADGSVTWE